MPVCKCYYRGELVHGFVLSERELKIGLAEPGGLKRQLMERLKRALPELTIDDPGAFDHVVEI